MKIRRERGAALFTALILLVILTLLGLSSMNTNIMEERMAANIQESYRALQAAEAGLDAAFADDAAFNTVNGEGQLTNNGSGNVTVGNETVTYEVTYVQSGLAGDYFDMRSTVTLPSGARVVLHAGVLVP